MEKSQKNRAFWLLERKKLYKSHRWRKIRQAHLKRQPFCQKCQEGEGQTDWRSFQLGHILDHIQPATDTESFWNPPKGFQVLCRRCHQDKNIEDKIWHRRQRLFRPVEF